MRTDWLVIGAGLTGATIAERIAAQRGESVLVVDRRDHIAGNAWDEYNPHGILEHKYGPHIFHTNSREVWHYLSRFTSWRPYFHRVRASVDGQLVPVPFNLNSISMLFPAAMAERLSNALVQGYGFGARVPVLKLMEAGDADLRFLADYVYRNVFEGYTRKQWDMSPTELAPSVTARVPVLVSRDDRYFQDTWQAMPADGYGTMVRRMLDHPRIRVLLHASWQDVAHEIQYRRMVFTGAIDEYFGYAHGHLPYRSLRFDLHTHDTALVQEAAVINFPNEYAYTRITELKHLTGQIHARSTTITEYPMPHVPGETIAYYPVPTQANRDLFEKYAAEAEKLKSHVFFAGRLGDYTYYNMDQAVARALKLVRDIGDA